MTLRAIFSKKYIVFTILVVLGMIGLVRLGIWQLDRLQQKQTFNALLAERWRSEPFNLNAESLPADLSSLEYRRVAAQGTFDYSHQLLVQDSGGYVVVTPLMLGDDRGVLVARGWIPTDQAEAAPLAQLQEPPGSPVLGLARQSQGLRNGEISTPAAIAQQMWYRIDVPAMQGQVPYQLEPGYIEMLPEAGRTANQFPLRSNPVPLDEGNHLSYAIQWFTFALVLGFGYIMLVRHRTRLAAGLIQPVPLAPPMPEPGTVVSTVTAVSTVTTVNADGTVSTVTAVGIASTASTASTAVGTAATSNSLVVAPPEPVVAGEQPRPQP